MHCKEILPAKNKVSIFMPRKECRVSRCLPSKPSATDFLLLPTSFHSSLILIIRVCETAYQGFPDIYLFVNGLNLNKKYLVQTVREAKKHRGDQVRFVVCLLWIHGASKYRIYSTTGVLRGKSSQKRRI